MPAELASGKSNIYNPDGIMRVGGRDGALAARCES
jgi:hypothetical protein